MASAFEFGNKIDVHHLHLGKKIGEGADGTVFLGSLEIMEDKQLAIKRISKLTKTNPTIISLRKTKIDKLIDISKILVHPNLSRLLAYGEDNDFYYLVYSLHKCSSLYDLLEVGWKERDKRFNLNDPKNIKRLRNILKGILEGLDYMHSKGIIHGDVKPENIMLDCETDKDGKVMSGSEKAVLIDFSSACYESDIECIKHSNNTVPYYNRKIPFSFSSDLRALGITLLEMIVGAPINTKRIETDVLAGIIHSLKIISESYLDCLNLKNLKEILLDCLEHGDKITAKKLLENSFFNN